MPSNTGRRVALSCGIVMLAFGTAIAARADRPLTAEEQQRANHLYTLFVAPCCWRQSVAVHQSPQGMHVRNEIDQDLVAGRSDGAIKAALIREYGHGILIDPEGMRGVLAYSVPMLTLAMGLLFVLRWIWKGVKPVQSLNSATDWERGASTIEDRTDGQEETLQAPKEKQEAG